MMQNNQKQNQQNLTVPPPVPEDDFAIPELTIKDESGASEKVNLTAAPQPVVASPAPAPSPVPSPNDDKNEDSASKLAEFREKAASLGAATADSTEDVVLADLEARAKADTEKKEEAVKIDDSLNKLDTVLEEKTENNQVNQAENQANQELDDDDHEEDIFISIEDFRDEIEKYKQAKETNVNQTNQESEAIDEEAVLANPMKPLSAIPVAPASSQNIDELVPEIDLDAEDIFDENKEAEEKQDSPSADLSKVQVKSKQELSRGQEQRKAVVQNIMKTETIYDRNKKPEKARRSLGSSEKDAYKTLTPVEELEVLSLEEWRRLGDIPAERMEKVKEKIELLGEKGILSQIKGLNAWRRSPVMQQYLDLGISALLDEKGIEEYMENVDDDNNLSFQEWMAINKLNSQLMI